MELTWSEGIMRFAVLIPLMLRELILANGETRLSVLIEFARSWFVLVVAAVVRPVETTKAFIELVVSKKEMSCTVLTRSEAMELRFAKPPVWMPVESWLMRASVEKVEATRKILVLSVDAAINPVEMTKALSELVAEKAALNTIVLTKSD